MSENAVEKKEVLRYAALGAGLAIIALIAFAAVAWSVSPSEVHSKAQSIAVGVSSFDDLSDRFALLAKEKGGVFAFDVLREALLPPNTDVHLLGHVIGDELYKQEGVEGIALCTQDFRNACSHTMVIGALSEYGEGALSLVREACREAPGGVGAYTMCYHGLGHGVLASFQYSLPETVDFCRQTGTKQYNNREYVECVGGAIMELVGGGGHDRDDWLAARKEYLTGPLEPCMSDIIPDEAKEVCLEYVTPEIWKHAGIGLGRPDPSKFQYAFDVCDIISKDQQDLRDACFGGFGKEFVPLVGSRDVRNVDELSAEKLKIAISWCEKASASDGKAACISESVDSLFWGGENDPYQSLLFCSLIEDEPLQATCYEAFSNNVAHYITDASLQESLCLEVPNEVREKCLTSY